MELKDKNVLVTGGGSGIGLAIALALARQGCRVAICSRDRDRIDAAARAIGGETGADVEPSVCDVGEPGDQAAWIEGTARAWNGIDIVVPNAGGPPPGKPGRLLGLRHLIKRGSPDHDSSSLGGTTSKYTSSTPSLKHMSW